MDAEVWKVGELAEQTGLSVRTLHHYDEIGLLRPSRRSGAGHRLYTAGDVVRLQQIKSLRQLGFSLEQIRNVLDGEEHSPVRVIRLHLTRLREQIERMTKLGERLEAIAARLESAERVSTQEFIDAIKEIEMIETFEKYYTPEQLAQLKARAEAVGQDRIREVEQEWPALIAAVRAEMEKGTDPTSEPVRKLAAKWQSLIEEFTGGDPAIAASLARMYREEPNVAADKGYTPDPDLSAYIGKALAAGH